MYIVHVLSSNSINNVAFKLCRFLIASSNVGTYIPYERHFKSRLLIFSTPFFNAVFNQEWLVIKTIYVLIKEILLFGSKICRL